MNQEINIFENSPKYITTVLRPDHLLEFVKFVELNCIDDFDDKEYQMFEFIQEKASLLLNDSIILDDDDTTTYINNPDHIHATFIAIFSLLVVKSNLMDFFDYDNYYKSYIEKMLDEFKKAVYSEDEMEVKIVTGDLWVVGLDLVGENKKSIDVYKQYILSNKIRVTEKSTNKLIKIIDNNWKIFNEYFGPVSNLKSMNIDKLWVIEIPEFYANDFENQYLFLVGLNKDSQFALYRMSENDKLFFVSDINPEFLLDNKIEEIYKLAKFSYFTNGYDQQNFHNVLNTHQFESIRKFL